MPPETGEERPVTLGEAVGGVRWDYDPTQRLLSPLVEAVRYFENFPWDGDLDEEPAAPPVRQE